MSVVIGIDLGTQSLKVLCLDACGGGVVATESAPLQLYQDENGVAEQQCHWWLDALRSALATIDPDIRRTASAIAVSGQQHGFVAIGAADEVLAPVKLWCDTSTSAGCSEIMAAFGGPEASIREVGNPILPGYTASKIHWFKSAYSSMYGKLETILLPHDYLNLYLTGERCMEVGDASGTGFLDIRRRKWSEKMLRAIDADRDLVECLPQLRVDNATIGQVKAEPAKELGIPANIPVGIGGGDNMMGAIGTGNLRPGIMTMSLGTSGTVYAYSDKPAIDPKGNIAAFCSSTGGWLPLLCTMNCTVSTELMRDLLDTDLVRFEAMISSAPPGADGVLTVPFFNGERTPNLPNAKGCIFGLDGGNTKSENVLRSAVEGATYALKFGIDELAGLGVDSTEIVLTGGGAKSAAWRQLVADVSDTRVTVFEQDEGPAFGAALQALQLINPGTSIVELADEYLTRDEPRCCNPRSAMVTQYAEAYHQYQQAVSAVATLYQ